MKRIGIMTTGGDCSGLNAVIRDIYIGVRMRKWELVGIIDGTDGLFDNPPRIIKFDDETLPVEMTRLSGSILHNGHAGATNLKTAAECGTVDKFNRQLRKALSSLDLDALILVGGNGSLSLAWCYRDVYADMQLVCIPKTIDADIPLTDTTIGFNTAVQQLTSYCDQLLMTARSHHRWFVVQAMGRDCGALALTAGVAVGASAILIPEVKFNTDELVAHIKKSPVDYGIIMVSEGVTIRGHSGRPGDMISRKLTAAGIANRTAYPEHIQRSGDTTAIDRLYAAHMADTALHAIENGETYVMTAMQDGTCKTVSLADFYAAGKITNDPNIKGVQTSDAYVESDNPLLQIAVDMGIYIGSVK